MHDINGALASAVTAQTTNHTLLFPIEDGHVTTSATAAAVSKNTTTSEFAPLKNSRVSRQLSSSAMTKAAAIVVTFNTRAAAQACLADLGPPPPPSVLKGLVIGCVQFFKSCCRACAGNDPLTTAQSHPHRQQQQQQQQQPQSAGYSYSGDGSYQRVARSEEEDEEGWVGVGSGSGGFKSGNLSFRPGYVPRCEVPLPPERVRWNCVGAAGVERRWGLYSVFVQSKKPDKFISSISSQT